MPTDNDTRGRSSSYLLQGISAEPPPSSDEIVRTATELASHIVDAWARRTAAELTSREDSSYRRVMQEGRSSALRPPSDSCLWLLRMSCQGAFWSGTCWWSQTIQMIALSRSLD